MKYDLETLLSDIVTILKANLNTKLTAIQTEKGDGLVCPAIDSTYGYAQQDLTQAVMNQKAFVLYGVDDIQTTSLAGAAAFVYSISVLVIIADDGNDADIFKKLFRYQRALKEIIETNSGALPPGQMEVSSGTPEKFRDVNTGSDYRVIGIFLKIALA